MIFLHGVERQEPVYLVGFIPLLVGVAQLAYVFLTPARDQQADERRAWMQNAKC